MRLTTIINALYYIMKILISTIKYIKMFKIFDNLIANEKVKNLEKTVKDIAKTVEDVKDLKIESIGDDMIEDIKDIKQEAKDVKDIENKIESK